MRDLLLTAAVLLVSVAAEDIHVFTHPAMGTEFELRIAAPYEHAEPAAAEAFELVDALEEEISSWRETSYTTYVNNHAAQEPVRVSPNLLELFSESKRLSEATYGAFDPTIGPLLDAWRIRTGGEPPSETAIEHARERVGMHHVTIDDAASTIAYDREGVWVDWGAIGKGYTLDRVADLLRRRGIESALISAGTSTIFAVGAPPGAAGWQVDIPATGTGAQPPPVLLSDAALSSSVCFENGSRPCDILDPRSGRPVSVASSATVIAESGLAADALSTALLVMSRDEAERFFNEYPAWRAIRFTSDTTPETYNWSN